MRANRISYTRNALNAADCPHQAIVIPVYVKTVGIMQQYLGRAVLLIGEVMSSPVGSGQVSDSYPFIKVSIADHEYCQFRLKLIP